MKEVALDFWSSADMEATVVALSKSYKVRTFIREYTELVNKPQPFMVVVEVPDNDVREVKE